MTFLYIILSSTLLILAGCATTSHVPNEQNVVFVRPPQSNDDINISFSTARGTLQYTLRPGAEDVYITMSGISPSSNAIVEDAKRAEEKSQNEASQRASKAEQEKAPPLDLAIDEGNKEPETKNSPEDIQKMLRAITRAQELFYQEKYGEALNSVASAISFGESAEAYGLKGSILLMMDDPTGALREWNNALKIDPSLPGLVDMIQRVGMESQ